MSCCRHTRAVPWCVNRLTHCAIRCTLYCALCCTAQCIIYCTSYMTDISLSPQMCSEMTTMPDRHLTITYIGRCSVDTLQRPFFLPIHCAVWCHLAVSTFHCAVYDRCHLTAQYTAHFAVHCSDCHYTGTLVAQRDDYVYALTVRCALEGHVECVYQRRAFLRVSRMSITIATP